MAVIYNGIVNFKGAEGAPPPRAPRAGDIVRILEVETSHGSPRAIKKYPPGFEGRVVSFFPYRPGCGILPGFCCVHFDAVSGGVWAKVVVLESKIEPEGPSTSPSIPGSTPGFIPPAVVAVACRWCGEDEERDVRSDELLCCGTGKMLEVRAEGLLRERLEVGGASDCLGERRSVLRLARSLELPVCGCCGSREGMPDGYGSRQKHQAGEQVASFGSSRHGLGTVCIACVQEGFGVLAKIERGFATKRLPKVEMEPGAAPHWPAQHSTPGWED